MSAETITSQVASVPSLEPIFSNLPILTTERLTLRPLEMNDAAAIFNYAADPQVSRFTLWDSPATIAQTRTFLTAVLENYRRGIPEDWAITRTTDPSCIGTIGLYNIDTENRSAEVHYALAADCAGKGYMTEALSAVITFATRTLKLNRIEACCMVGNTGSERVLQKAGMKFEGIRRSAALKNGLFSDLKQYALVNGDIP